MEQEYFDSVAVTGPNLLDQGEVVYSSGVSHRKVHRNVAVVTAPPAEPKTLIRRWYETPVWLVILGALVGGVPTYVVARWQVNQVRQETELDQRIDNRIGSKLQPLNEDIAKLREDVAYVKAKVEDATSKKIVGFSKLPANRITASLPEISKIIAEARTKEILAPPEAVVELRNKLAQIQTRDAQFWVAVSSIVNYQSLIVEKINLFPNVEQVRQKPCVFVLAEPGASQNVFDGGGESGCMQQIDNGIVWKNFTFENALIIYKGGPLHLENVTFKNCLFLVEFTHQPTPGTERFASALLASTNIIASFKLSAG